ncbi:hypothetical protein ACSBR1_040695 [Camellia fascicularis]
MSMVNNNVITSVGTLVSTLIEFCNMTYLKELDLSGNSIEDIKGKLELLRLNWNSFNNSILSSLGVLSSLKTLSLFGYCLNGSIDIGEFRNMNDFEKLDLSDKSIEDIKVCEDGGDLKWKLIFASFERLSVLGKLELLDLSQNSFNNGIVPSLDVLSSLKTLNLRGINLNGSIDIGGWCELSNLQELDLSENGFSGMLPSCLEDLTSIRILDLSFNQFIGNLTSSPLSNLTTLEYLILSYNHFEIPVSFISFSNHSKLKVYLGDNNRLSDQIEFQTWFLKFQLKVFSLSNCGSNNLGMKFPHFLFYQYDLRIVDLSHILVGTFLVWLLENNMRLEVFHLINCSLTGPFLLPSYPNPHANSIDISNNHLEGPIPTNMGSIFPNLRNLNSARNLIHGHIPTSLGDMH